MFSSSDNNSFTTVAGHSPYFNICYPYCINYCSWCKNFSCHSPKPVTDNRRRNLRQNLFYCL